MAEGGDSHEQALAEGGHKLAAMQVNEAGLESMSSGSNSTSTSAGNAGPRPSRGGSAIGCQTESHGQGHALGPIDLQAEGPILGGGREERSRAEGPKHGGGGVGGDEADKGSQRGGGGGEAEGSKLGPGAAQGRQAVGATEGCESCRAAWYQWLASLMSRYPLLLLRISLLVVVLILVVGITLPLWAYMSKFAEHSITDVAALLRPAVLTEVTNYLHGILSNAKMRAEAMGKTLETHFEHHPQGVLQSLHSEIAGLIFAHFFSTPPVNGARLVLSDGTGLGYRLVQGPQFFFVNSSQVVDKDDNIGPQWYSQPCDPSTGAPLGEPFLERSVIPSAAYFLDDVTAGNLTWVVQPGSLNQSLLMANYRLMDRTNASYTWGVATVHYRLNLLSAYLASLELKQGIVYLAMDNGILLAASEDSISTISGDGSSLVLSNETNNEYVNAVAEYIHSTYGGYDALLNFASWEGAELSLAGKAFYVDVAPVLEENLAMVAVLLIPRQSIRGRFQRARRDALLTVIAVTGAVLLLGLLTLLVVTGAVGRNVRTVADFSVQEEAMRRAQERSEYKTKFLANVSHDLRSPIAGIIGMLDIMLDDQLTSEQDSNLRQVRSCASSLCSLLNDLLDVTKVEAGKMELESVEFDLVTELESMVDLFAVQACQYRTELSLDLSDDIVTNRVVIGDPSRVRQVLANVISNACKFSRGGHVVIRTWRWPRGVPHTKDGYSPRLARLKRRGRHSLKWLRLRTSSDDVHEQPAGVDGSDPAGPGLPDADGLHVVALEVEDDGIGIPKEQWDSIFEAFVQADSTTSRKFGGTGLGLSITRSLTRLMGGDIYIREKDSGGSGTCFRFFITFRSPIRSDGPGAAAATGCPSPSSWAESCAGPQLDSIIISDGQAEPPLAIQRSDARRQVSATVEQRMSTIGINRRPPPPLTIPDSPSLSSGTATPAFRFAPMGYTTPTGMNTPSADLTPTANNTRKGNVTPAGIATVPCQSHSSPAAAFTHSLDGTGGLTPHGCQGYTGRAILVLPEGSMDAFITAKWLRTRGLRHVNHVTSWEGLFPAVTSITTGHEQFHLASAVFAASLQSQARNGDTRGPAHPQRRGFSSAAAAGSSPHPLVPQAIPCPSPNPHLPALKSHPSLKSLLSPNIGPSTEPHPSSVEHFLAACPSLPAPSTSLRHRVVSHSSPQPPYFEGAETGPCPDTVNNKSVSVMLESGPAAGMIQETEPVQISEERPPSAMDDEAHSVNLRAISKYVSEIERNSKVLPKNASAMEAILRTTPKSALKSEGKIPAHNLPHARPSGADERVATSSDIRMATQHSSSYGQGATDDRSTSYGWQSLCDSGVADVSLLLIDWSIVPNPNEFFTRSLPGFVAQLKWVWEGHHVERLSGSERLSLPDIEGSSSHSAQAHGAESAAACVGPLVDAGQLSERADRDQGAEGGDQVQVFEGGHQGQLPRDEDRFEAVQMTYDADRVDRTELCESVEQRFEGTGKVEASPRLSWMTETMRHVTAAAGNVAPVSGNVTPVAGNFTAAVGNINLSPGNSQPLADDAALVPAAFMDDSDLHAPADASDRVGAAQQLPLCAHTGGGGGGDQTDGLSLPGGGDQTDGLLLPGGDHTDGLLLSGAGDHTDGLLLPARGPSPLFLVWLVDPSTPGEVRHELRKHGVKVVSRPLYASRLQLVLEGAVRAADAQAGEVTASSEGKKSGEELGTGYDFGTCHDCGASHDHDIGTGLMMKSHQGVGMGSAGRSAMDSSGAIGNSRGGGGVDENGSGVRKDDDGTAASLPVNTPHFLCPVSVQQRAEEKRGYPGGTGWGGVGTVSPGRKAHGVGEGKVAEGNGEAGGGRRKEGDRMVGLKGQGKVEGGEAVQGQGSSSLGRKLNRARWDEERMAGGAHEGRTEKQQTRETIDVGMSVIPDIKETGGDAKLDLKEKGLEDKYGGALGKVDGAPVGMHAGEIALTEGVSVAKGHAGQGERPLGQRGSPAGGRRDLMTWRPLEGLDVLVAEDTAVLRKVAVTALKKLGATVTAVCDGQQVVDAVAAVYAARAQNHDTVRMPNLGASQSAWATGGSDGRGGGTGGGGGDDGNRARPAFAVCLMDCAMPVCDGYLATAKIRELESPIGVHMPIIALTAHAMKSDAEKCLAAGMDAYLAKPLGTAQLVAALQHLHVIGASPGQEKNLKLAREGRTPLIGAEGGSE